MKILITGGAGFIGSNLAHYFTSEGHQVTVIDNLITGHLHNLEDIRSQINFIEGDIRDQKLMQQACQGQDYVFHQAALPSVPRSVDDPWSSNDYNTNGTLSVLIAARDAKVKRVILAASSSAYGNTPVLPKIETMPDNPRSPYAVSKLVGELYAKVFWQVYGLETVILRYFNVFGYRQDPKSAYAAVIPKFICAYLDGKPVQIQGDGEQTRDFTFIENVMEANHKAMLAPVEQVAGEVFNVGYGGRMSLNELIVEIEKLVGQPLDKNYVEPRTGDVRDSQAAIQKATNCMGYTPKVDLVEGLYRTYDWYKENHSIFS